MIPITLITSVSAAADKTRVIDLVDRKSFSIQVDLTSVTSIVGTIKLRCSINGTTWMDVPDSSVSVNSVATDVCQVYFKNDASYRYVELNWDYTSGAATLVAVAIIKEENKPL